MVGFLVVNAHVAKTQPHNFKALASSIGCRNIDFLDFSFPEAVRSILWRWWRGACLVRDPHHWSLHDSHIVRAACYPVIITHVLTKTKITGHAGRVVKHHRGHKHL